jgi:LAO/AO transport system kinase
MAKEKKSALKVNKGVEQPPAVNREAARRFKSRKSNLMPDSYYTEGIVNGNRTILAKAITLIESALPEHRQKASNILAACLPRSGNSVRIGITGVPGAGKSTFIEAFGKHLTSLGHKVAILAIDPSSSRSKGSILGDKTRMESLSADPNAFIRPSPSSGSLGGVARKTFETIIVCEAAGYDVILIETVGVGQSETEARSMVDFFLLLMLAGAGDELQGIKRGIIEMSDAIIINKADGDNIAAAARAVAEYKNALHLFPAPPSGWTPQAGKCSALTGDGITEIWNMIEDYVSLTKTNGYFDKNRIAQQVLRFRKSVEEAVLNKFFENKNVKQKLQTLEKEIENKKINVYSAADEILKEFSANLPD